MASSRAARDVAAARRSRRADGRLVGIERALASERADSLGRAGAKLEDAIEVHRLLQEVGLATDEQLAAALQAVRDALWGLLVQRECVGFRGDNLGWIRRHYPVPVEAVRRL